MKTLDLKQVLNGQSAGQTRKTYSAGETIAQQGEAAAALFYIERGQVAVSVVLHAGKEAIVGVRGPGDFFGLRALLGGGPRRASGIALTDCIIIHIEKSLATRLLQERLEFAGMFNDYLLRQHLRDLKRIISQSYPAKERLRQTLIEISNLSASGPAQPIKITQTMLANLVGTTRSRVSLFMNNFRRRGLVEYDRAGMLIVRKTLDKALQSRE
ncbi:MAG TPA: Crp/Fnr family transcriptional regulator [Xanthobacteraceae bacterium]|nr:Crp/Fnr family transcriptional regulator [Xanthobacteraceae bacterium]